jgi:hypothetical protein
MNPALVRRQASLAAVALLAALAALALGRLEGRNGEGISPGPPAGGDRWQQGLAAPYVPSSPTSSCGVELTPQTRGIRHPVLPCGVDLVLVHGQRQARTEVVDRGPGREGAEFALTTALARELRLSGPDTIYWRFAR